eukprot:COSAG01_NODE_17159_length_1170_cov_3.748603_1_plen_85_part_00
MLVLVLVLLVLLVLVLVLLVLLVLLLLAGKAGEAAGEAGCTLAASCLLPPCSLALPAASCCATHHTRRLGSHRLLLHGCCLLPA